MPNTWPTFMQKDPVANVFFGRLPDAFGDYQLLALDEQGAIVAQGPRRPVRLVGQL